MTGDEGVFLLPDMTESVGGKEDEVEGNSLELELPSVLPLEKREVTEVLEGPVD